MNDRLQAALDHANYRSTIAQQKENLRIRCADLLIHAQNGGVFTASPALIGFLDFLIRREETQSVILDDKGNPILIEDLEDFRDALYSTYVEATNEFHQDYEKLRKARSVKAAVGL